MYLIIIIASSASVCVTLWDINSFCTVSNMWHEDVLVVFFNPPKGVQTESLYSVHLCCSMSIHLQLVTHSLVQEPNQSFNSSVRRPISLVLSHVVVRWCRPPLNSTVTTFSTSKSDFAWNAVQDMKLCRGKLHFFLRKIVSIQLYTSV